MTKEELLAKLDETQKARAIEVGSIIEVKKLENELTYLNSDSYITDEILANDNRIIANITKPLDEISDKHFTRFQEFNFGVQANGLIGAIRTIMLQKHKKGYQAIETAKLLDDNLAIFADIVELHAQAFPDAIGRNTYFDKLSGVIVQGTIGDAVQVRAILERVGREIQLVDPDFHQITQDRLIFIEEKGSIRAEKQLEDNLLLTPDNDTYQAEEPVIFATI